MSFRALASCAFLLASPAFAQDPVPQEAPQPGPANAGEELAPKLDEPKKQECDGRNPYYCGIVVQNQEAGEGDGEEGEIEKILRPPGGCEGRNPKYCEERVPETPEADTPEAERKQGRNASNPSRNPNRRPGGRGAP